MTLKRHLQEKLQRKWFFQCLVIIQMHNLWLKTQRGHKPVETYTSTIASFDPWPTSLLAASRVWPLTHFTHSTEQQKCIFNLLHCRLSSSYNKQMLVKKAPLTPFINSETSLYVVLSRVSQTVLIYLTHKQTWWTKIDFISPLPFSSLRPSMSCCLISAALLDTGIRWFDIFVWASLRFPVLGLPVPFEIKNWITFFETSLHSTFSKEPRHVLGGIYE